MSTRGILALSLDSASDFSISDQAIIGRIPVSLPMLRLESPRPAAPSNLEWRETGYLSPARFIIDLPPVERSAFKLGEFSRALKSAHIADIGAIPLAGSMIMLPAGVRLLERFASDVRTELSRIQFEEYDYPFLCPLEFMAPMSGLLDLTNRLLLVGNDQDWLDQTPRAALCPSGEQLIYSHFRHLMRDSSRSEVRLFRRARYYRPLKRGKHSGLGIFSSQESSDVFEAFGCFLDEHRALQALQQLALAWDRVFHTWRLPVIWSLRSPWGNNGQLYEWSLGADLLLPHGQSVQLGTIYNHGQKFSRPFQVTSSHSGKREHTWHVVGSISRRSLLAHLFLSLKEDGNFAPHPAVAPDQVVMLCPASDERRSALEVLAETLTRGGIRTVLRPYSNDTERQRYRAGHRASGLPLLIQIERRQSEVPRFILTRSDSHRESVVTNEALLRLAIEELLPEMEIRFDERIAHYGAQNLRAAHSIAEAFDAIGGGGAAQVPLIASAETEQSVRKAGPGDILGYIASASAQPCVVTGAPTEAIGVLARRI